MSNIDYSLSTDLQNAVTKAQLEARRRTQDKFSSGHLLWGLLHDDSGLIQTFEILGKEVPRLRNWAEFRMENYPKSTRVEETPPGDERVQNILKEANRIRVKDFASAILPLHTLEAICMPNIGFTEEQLQRFPISLAEVKALKGDKKESEVIQESIQPGSHKKAGISKALNQYCEDITEKARNKKIDPVLGRDKEILDLMQILGKRNSPNVLLVGEPGVGKTALVGGLALNIIAGNVPLLLKDVSIFELDVNGSLVAGAYKGEVEERLKKVLTAVKELGRAILFIDEMHVLLDERSSVGSGAVNLMKPELARGEIIVIGATTQTEYKRFIEKDFAFARRFTRLTIEEPSEEEAVNMLKGLIPRYQDHHKLEILEGTANESVYLAKRYITTKRLPVSAIEVIDLTMSSAQVMNDTSDKALKKMRKEIDAITKLSDEEKQIAQLAKLVESIPNKLSYLLLRHVEEFGQLKKIEVYNTLLVKVNEILTQLSDVAAKQKTKIGPDDITATVANLSGVPLGKVKTKEAEKWLKIKEVLQKRVVGQDHAIDVIADTLRRSRAGLKEDNEPVGVFFFTGPTGTGKTELAKAIAEFLFDQESAMIRFDMSEFMQPHSVETLLGAPGGYVGHEEGGVLVNKIRQKPYAVILFDEIEKAHPDVYKIFLQILEEGRLTDRLDKRGDFTKSVIIFTSNAGSDWIVEQLEKSAGEIPEENKIREYLVGLKDAKGEQIFRKEFVNRRLKIIPFKPLAKEVTMSILNIQLNRYSKLFKNQGITLEVSEKARNYLIDIGFNPMFGARPLRDVIKEHIGTAAADKIIAGELGKKQKLYVDLGPEEVLVFSVNSSS